MLFFFFFKQKTAYEMRISDWSSDVCSSDLYHSAGLTSSGTEEQPATDRIAVAIPARIITLPMPALRMNPPRWIRIRCAAIVVSQEVRSRNAATGRPPDNHTGRK